ncbi:monovalent cation:proton antiporter family protein [Methanoregula sp.]|uniref:monovalent cation:proton antiporter family protein n=1 Tax=Methanoregula sp. TaxID=2052170 RepID=UPI00236BFF3E|nr:monovalent cation:proton antiporter family protein [Methanoregula sp.]MDD1686833.1 cation:proton antiporter [Methanoregula sp.]
MDILVASVSVLILAVLLLYFGQRLKIPSIVSYLIIGILVGPYSFGIITNQDAIDAFGNIGIVLLLFTIGLEFSFQKLLRSWRTVIIGGSVQVLVTIVAITLLTEYLGMPFSEALIFGFIVSLSSTAIVMKILQEKGEVDTLQGRTLLGILIFQDLAIIPMMLIAPMLVGSGGIDLNSLPFQIGKVAIILLVIIVMARWVIPAFLYKVACEKNRELFLITLAGICVLIAWLTSEAGLSFTLGAFIAGLIIGESDYNINALGHIIPFRDVFAAIFFLSIGMLLNTQTIFSDFYYVAMIVVTIIVVKILTGAVAAAVIGMPLRVCVFSGLALCQIGEFSFVLAKTGLDSALIPNVVYQIFLAAAIITMALTPFTMNAAPKTVDLIYRIVPARILKQRAEPAEEIEKDLSNHLIIAGYGITGKSVARAAAIAGISYMVIELNPAIIRQERSTFRPNFMFGDAVQAEVLEHAGIRRARTLVIVVSDEDAIPRIINTARELAPGVHILARTRRVREARALLDLGADEVISEEFEASVEIFSRVLRKYQLPDEEINYIIKKTKAIGTTLFAKSTTGEAELEDPSILFNDRHVHSFLIEPGSKADGKTIGELELHTRFGIGEFGIRSGGRTTSRIQPARKLSAGESLITFITDETAREVAPLFAKKVNS